MIIYAKSDEFDTSLRKNVLTDGLSFLLSSLAYLAYL